MRGGPIAVLATHHSHTEQIPHCRVVDIVTRSRTGKVPLPEEPGAMRRPNVLVPLDRTMQLPLTLAGGSRTTIVECESAEAALLIGVRKHEPIHLEGRERTVRRKSRWQLTTHTAQRHGSAYRSRSA